MLPFSPLSLYCWWLHSPEPEVTPGPAQVPNTALGEPIGVAAVAGSGVCPPEQCPGQRWVTLLGAAPELQCSLELRLCLKNTPKSYSLERNEPWGVHSRAGVSSLSPSTCQTGGGWWSSLCNLLQPGTDASAELRASSAAWRVQREGKSIPFSELFVTLISLPDISRICSCLETLPVLCDLFLRVME